MEVNCSDIQLEVVRALFLPDWGGEEENSPYPIYIGFFPFFSKSLNRFTLSAVYLTNRFFFLKTIIFSDTEFLTPH